jgi:large subunit ribosomal protein L32
MTPGPTRAGPSCGSSSSNSYHLASVAVPKQRTSRTRRDKRRAQHRARRPRLNECPRCHSQRLPHRVCPVCGTYAGREVIKPEVAEAPAPAGQQPSPEQSSPEE